MSEMEPAIRVTNVWKRYGLPVAHWLARLRGVPVDDPKFWALRDLSFEVRKGETLGIVGRNGAGKSTLLKVLSGVTPATRGTVGMSGRIFPMIELNAGIHPDLTGRENVRFLGTVMGFSSRDMRARMPAIEDFAELGDWFDRPVRQYSSGMQARLGFAVAMNVDADILLIDEVLAVGDMSFQRKCFARMAELRGKATVIFVSHSLLMVERICDRGLFLERGGIAASGTASEAISVYSRQALADQRSAAQKGISSRAQAVFPASSQEPVVITRIELLDEHGNAGPFETGKPLIIRIHYQANERIENAFCGITISNDQLISILRVNNEHAMQPTLWQEGSIDCIVPVLPLLKGIYSIAARLYDANYGAVSTPYDTELFDVAMSGWYRKKCAGFFYLETDWHCNVVENPSRGAIQ